MAITVYNKFEERKIMTDAVRRENQLNKLCHIDSHFHIYCRKQSVIQGRTHYCAYMQGSCSAHTGNSNINTIPYYPLSNTHLEKVILVHNTAVGQRLDQLICQGGFTTICDSVSER